MLNIINEKVDFDGTICNFDDEATLLRERAEKSVNEFPQRLRDRNNVPLKDIRIYYDTIGVKYGLMSVGVALHYYSHKRFDDMLCGDNPYLKHLHTDIEIITSYIATAYFKAGKVYDFVPHLLNNFMDFAKQVLKLHYGIDYKRNTEVSLLSYFKNEDNATVLDDVIFCYLMIILWGRNYDYDENIIKLAMAYKNYVDGIKENILEGVH